VGEDEVVQAEVVEDDDAGITQRSFIDRFVIDAVPHVVEGSVELPALRRIIVDREQGEGG